MMLTSSERRTADQLNGLILTDIINYGQLIPQISK